jgi:hypothetical protein
MNGYADTMIIAAGVILPCLAIIIVTALIAVVVTLSRKRRQR